LTYQVEAHLFSACAFEGKVLLSSLEEGELPDLGILTRTFGTAFEFAICDLFSQDEASSRYWVDGVIIDAVTSHPGRIVEVRGTAWCADHREQWQVPVEIVCRFADDRESTYPW